MKKDEYNKAIEESAQRAFEAYMEVTSCDINANPYESEEKAKYIVSEIMKLKK
jgi:hypothetical protein